MSNYVQSNKIHIYPCANRTGYDIESKLNTEFNLTHLAANSYEGSYLIDSSKIKDQSNSPTNYYYFVIGGYFVKAEKTAVNEAAGVTSANTNIFANIKLKSKALGTNSENTTILCNFKEVDNDLDISTTESGTTTSYFYGVKFTTSAETGTSVISLQIAKAIYDTSSETPTINNYTPSYLPEIVHGSVAQSIKATSNNIIVESPVVGEYDLNLTGDFYLDSSTVSSATAKVIFDQGDDKTKTYLDKAVVRTNDFTVTGESFSLGITGNSLTYLGTGSLSLVANDINIHTGGNAVKINNLEIVRNSSDATYPISLNNGTLTTLVSAGDVALGKASATLAIIPDTNSTLKLSNGTLNLPVDPTVNGEYELLGSRIYNRVVSPHWIKYSTEADAYSIAERGANGSISVGDVNTTGAIVITNTATDTVTYGTNTYGTSKIAEVLSSATFTTSDGTSATMPIFRTDKIQRSYIKGSEYSRIADRVYSGSYVDTTGSSYSYYKYALSMSMSTAREKEIISIEKPIGDMFDFDDLSTIINSSNLTVNSNSIYISGEINIPQNTITVYDTDRTETKTKISDGLINIIHEGQSGSATDYVLTVGINDGKTTSNNLTIGSDGSIISNGGASFVKGIEAANENFVVDTAGNITANSITLTNGLYQHHISGMIYSSILPNSTTTYSSSTAQQNNCVFNIDVLSSIETNCSSMVMVKKDQTDIASSETSIVNALITLIKVITNSSTISYGTNVERNVSGILSPLSAMDTTTSSSVMYWPKPISHLYYSYANATNAVLTKIYFYSPVYGDSSCYENGYIYGLYLVQGRASSHIYFDMGNYSKNSTTFPTTFSDIFRFDVYNTTDNKANSNLIFEINDTVNKIL